MSTSGGGFAGNVPQPAGTVVGPDAFGAAAAPGVSAAYSRGDHDHGLPASPVAFAAPTIALGTAGATGAAGTVIRSDATIAAFDATAPVAQNFGDAAATGTAAFAARRDHTHGMPANPVSFAAPAVALGTAAAAGVAATVIRSDATIVAFDVTAPVTQAFGDAAAVGVAAVAARRDHRHGMPAAPVSALTLIASSVLGADAASVVFSSIPGTFNHLMVVGVARSAAVAESDAFAVRFNGDTGANYDLTAVIGVTTAVSGKQNPAATSMTLLSGQIDMAAANATAGAAGRLHLLIPFYAGASWRKIVEWASGYSDVPTSTTDVSCVSGVGQWRSTAAINSVTIFPVSAANLKAGSAFYLYGVT